MRSSALSCAGRGLFAAILLSLRWGQAAPVPVVLDTDIGPDPGDIATVALLHALADRGEVRILATINCTSSEWGPLALNALNHYYGRPDLPVGTLQEPGFLTERTAFNKAIALRYSRTLREAGQAMDSTRLYRKVLAGQPDRSVTVIAIGPLRALKLLLKSGADEFSPLTGRELVGRKVRELSCMGGWYPNAREQGPEWNFEQDAGAAREVCEHWPTPIMFADAGLGFGVMTGRRQATDAPEYDPVALALALFPDTRFGEDRPSWDQLSVLYAARGLGEYWTATQGGCNRIGEKGANTFTTDSDHGHRFLQKRMSATDLEAVLDDLMVGAREGAHDFYFNIATYASDGMGTVRADSGEGGRAFDRDARSAWRSESSRGWIEYECADGKRYVISKYTLASVSAGSAPGAWSLQGANDPAKWTTLDTRTNEAFAAGEMREFGLTNTVAFNRYRLAFTGPHPVELATIELLEHIGNTPGVIVNEVRLEPSQLTLPAAGRAAMNVTLRPADAGQQRLVWTSSDPAVATVKRTGKNSAMVSGVGTGHCRITVAPEAGGTAAACAVTITASPLPAGWTYEEINAPAVPGGASYREGVFTVTGGGGAIQRWWQRTWDQFSMLSQAPTGDTTIAARVLTQTASDRGAIAGVMFRESTARDSRFVLLGLQPDREVFLTWRDGPEDEGPRTKLGKFDPPVHLKLERRGDTFHAYVSTDGESWGRPLGAHAGRNFEPTMKVGLAVCAHKNPTTSTVEFDRVSVRQP